MFTEAVEMALRVLDNPSYFAGPFIKSEDREGLYAFLVRNFTNETIHIVLVTFADDGIFDMEFINEDEEDDGILPEIDMFFVDEDDVVVVECSNRLQGRAHVDECGNLRKIPCMLW